MGNGRKPDILGVGERESKAIADLKTIVRESFEDIQWHQPDSHVAAQQISLAVGQLIYWFLLVKEFGRNPLLHIFFDNDTSTLHFNSDGKLELTSKGQTFIGDHIAVGIKMILVSHYFAVRPDLDDEKREEVLWNLLEKDLTEAAVEPPYQRILLTGLAI